MATAKGAGAARWRFPTGITSADELGGSLERWVRIPKQHVGLIIGKKFARVKRIATETGAAIKSPSEADEPVFFCRGTESAANAASDTIEAIIRSRMARDEIESNYTPPRLTLFQLPAPPLPSFFPSMVLPPRRCLPFPVQLPRAAVQSPIVPPPRTRATRDAGPRHKWQAKHHPRPVTIPPPPPPSPPAPPPPPLPPSSPLQCPGAATPEDYIQHLVVENDAIFQMLQSETIPDEYVCPLSHEIMRDPVRTSAHSVYERAFIQKWLMMHDTDPITNTRLADLTLVPVAGLRGDIQRFLQGVKASFGSSHMRGRSAPVLL